MKTTPTNVVNTILPSTEEVQLIETNPNVSFLNTIRNSGYNNYTAIADIIDNSLEPNVNSSKISINFESDTKGEFPYKNIRIIDDGCGMDYLTILESMKLGANTGKSKKDDLGSYGTGLKAAALSIGKRFTLQTKSIDDDFYIVDFDLDEIMKKGKFLIPIRKGSFEEYDNFKKETNSESGTIITLLKLDRCMNKNITIFSDILNNNLSLFYSSFIDESNVSITINNKEVKSFDPMHRNEAKTTRLSKHNEIFTYNNKEYVFNVFFIAKDGQKANKDIHRNRTNAGLYIYRNRRYVGGGLDLGIIMKSEDGYKNGLRIELFIDGEDDVLFSSTFMKMINEKDRNEIDQGFRDAARNALVPYIKSAEILEGKGKGDKPKEEQIAEFDSIMALINKNKLIKTEKVGGNKKLESPIERKETKHIGRNKFSSRKRNDVFAKWELENLGEFGPVFNVTKENGKYIIHINIDHLFWTEFLRDATLETKNIIARLFVSIGLSLNSVSYFDDMEKQILMTEYFGEMRSQLRKLIKE